MLPADTPMAPDDLLWGADVAARLEQRGLEVGIFVESHFTSGGAFHYDTACLQALLAADLRPHQLQFLTTQRDNVEAFAALGLPVEFFPYGGLRRKLDRHLLASLLRRPTAIDRRLAKRGFDLVYFLDQSSVADCLSRTHYISTVWDLCHREYMEFPEVYEDGEYHRRERFFRQTLPRAVAVMTNCERLKQQISGYYSVEPRRIQVAEFMVWLDPADDLNVTEILRRHGLQDRRYIFYPAQFWAHKNHIYILEALAILGRDYGVPVDAVFSGRDKGVLAHVRRTAERLGLGAQVHFPGFVPAKEIPALYQGALALVMPSYFGPTNLPPLEARALGCPVIYSDLPDFREATANSFLYCDLEQPASLAELVYQLLQSPPEARLRLPAATSGGAEAYVQTVKLAFDRYARLRSRWS
jgi:glycosyltransferase involved in cell wall biosynthesis